MSLKEKTAKENVLMEKNMKGKCQSLDLLTIKNVHAQFWISNVHYIKYKWFLIRELMCWNTLRPQSANCYSDQVFLRNNWRNINYISGRIDLHDEPFCYLSGGFDWILPTCTLSATWWDGIIQYANTSQFLLTPDG